MPFEIAKRSSDIFSKALKIKNKKKLGGKTCVLIQRNGNETVYKLSIEFK